MGEGAGKAEGERWGKETSFKESLKQAQDKLKKCQQNDEEDSSTLIPACSPVIYGVAKYMS